MGGEPTERNVTVPITAGKLAEMYTVDVEERMDSLRAEQAYGLPEDVEKEILEKLEHWEITLAIIRRFQVQIESEEVASLMESYARGCHKYLKFIGEGADRMLASGESDKLHEMWRFLGNAITEKNMLKQ